MLIRYTVGNFLSFNEPQEFSMISGKGTSKSDRLYKDKKVSLLKIAAIFGANASGKSNLIDSMKFAQLFIVKEIPIQVVNRYCKLYKENKAIPSTFEFEIKIDKKYYAYGFKIIVNKMSIVEEWLYEIGSKEIKIFERSVKNKEINFGECFDKDILTKLQTYADSMASSDTILFLTEMNRNKGDLYKNHPKVKFLEDIYKWFEENLKINYPNEPISHYSYLMDEKNKDEIYTLISSLGLGIKNCQIVNENIEYLENYMPKGLLKDLFEDLEKNKVKKQKSNKPKEETEIMLRGGSHLFFIKYSPEKERYIVQKLQFEHEKEGIWFDLNEESDGTRRMLDLIELIIAANYGSKSIYVIDEIDRSLHPQLTYKLIESYLRLVDKSELQLIFTTHESHILDLKLLRRDEIWFVNKNQEGESSLYSLEQYNERFDKKINKAYLDGRYGAVPLFDEIFPMKEKMNESL
ncbi:MAG: AAA family ATPase [Methanogenium sp.]|jgi:hypothetical protein